jgi:hypothetical protein
LHFLTLGFQLQLLVCFAVHFGDLLLLLALGLLKLTLSFLKLLETFHY